MKATVEQPPIGALAITPYPPRGLVRIVAPGGIFHGRQMIEVRHVGEHPCGYPPDFVGFYYADDLRPIEAGHDAFCMQCEWTGRLSELSVFDDLRCNACGSFLVSSIPTESEVA